jgi:hypothetical protein
MRRRFVAMLFSAFLVVLATAAIAQVFNPPADPIQKGAADSKTPAPASDSSYSGRRFREPLTTTPETGREEPKATAPNSLTSQRAKPDFPSAAAPVKISGSGIQSPAAESQAGQAYYTVLTAYRFQPGVGELVQKWKLAQNEADRAKIEQSLQALLKEQFQARLETNEKEISQLEAEVKRLRGQVELRRKKQDEIIEFRLTQLLREAQGLGWGTEPEMRPGAMRWAQPQAAIAPGYYPAKVEPDRNPFGSPAPVGGTVSPAGQPAAPAPAERAP